MVLVLSVSSPTIVVLTVVIIAIIPLTVWPTLRRISCRVRRVKSVILVIIVRIVRIVTVHIITPIIKRLSRSVPCAATTCVS